MNGHSKNTGSGTRCLLYLIWFGVVLSGSVFAEDKHNLPGLTAHEWGTFTAIAGVDGDAMEWTPFAGPSELPEFVEHFSYSNFKLGLRGTIRMETPVLYFYAPRDVNVSVRVTFSKGIITEWYPH